MTKSKKKSRKGSPAESNKVGKKSYFFEKERNVDYLLLVITAIFLVILLKPLVIDRLSPQGVDVVAGMAKTHQVNLFKKQTGEIPLWNPFLFSGMPLYQRLGAIAFSLDTILHYISRYLNMVFIFYLFGAFGFYFLLRRLNLSPLQSFLGMLLFILMPHYKSLYVEGHFMKFRAIMYIPWIFLTFLYFLEKRTILSTALFALIFGVQIRTQHYQIVLYTALLIFSIGIYPFFKELIDKNYKKFATSLILLLTAIILSIAMSAQPLFLAKEYLPFSKRGKTTIDISKQKSEQQTKVSEQKGVSLEYATQWSTAPSEMFTWLIPRFYGGMSSEKYTGKVVPQLRNRVLPGYWGKMPFTQSYEYMGVITLLLALIGLYANRKNNLIRSLFIFMIFLILLSFGHHFKSFYGLFFYYFPFFDKFRAPMMSVTVTSMLMAFFAAFGIKEISELTEFKKISDYKTVFYIIGSFAVLGLIIWIVSFNFSFLKAGENYNQQIQTMLIKIRKEYFINDLLRYFMILTTGALIIWASLMNKLKINIAISLLIILSVIDLLGIQARDTKKYVNVKRLEKKYFRKNPTDQFILKDKETFRIFPTGKMFGDNRWVYYHQSIGGYSPIKMYTIEELITNNLYNGPDKRIPFNWNMLKFLNVKYIIIRQNIYNPNIELVNADKQNQMFTYRFKDRLNRAFFVGDYIIEPDEYKRLRLINKPTFDAAKTAILEEQMSMDIALPDSQQVKLTLFNPNRSVYEVYTDKTSLLVISELFYPPGWKISIDGKPAEKIYKTDHAIQSIIVPQGKHKIELLFHPDSYFRNVRISYASLSIIYLLILFGLYKEKGAELLRKRTSNE